MVKRFLDHLMWPEWRLKSKLNASARKKISDAVYAAEVGHKAEIKVFIEGSFTLTELIKGISAHDKALDVFSKHRVWDTDSNTGVLLYFLIADKKIELVFDRGVASVFSHEDSVKITDAISLEISKNGIIEGVIKGAGLLHSEFLKRIPSVGETKSTEKLSDDVIVSR